MSRCLSCNRVLTVTDLKYKQKETKDHDGFCTGCRSLCFDTTPMHEYVMGVETESLVKRIESGETLTVQELPNINGDEDYE